MIDKMIDLLRTALRRIRIDKIISQSGKWGSLWNYKHGFLQSTIDVCGINKNNYKQFISDREYWYGHPYNGSYTTIIDNKLWLPLLLKDYLEHCPKYYFFKDKSGFIDLTINKRTSIDNVLCLIEAEKIVALKHTHSSLGKGFYKVSTRDDGDYLLNDDILNKEQFQSFLESLDCYLFTEYVIQHRYSQEIAPKSLNTLRLLTVWDYDKKSFFVARAFHRFGANGSTVDNLAAGNGVLVYIDKNTGITTGEGVVKTFNKDNSYTKNVVHPNVNVDLSNLVIPNFSEIMNKIIDIANSHSYLRYIGWDFAITDDGFKVIETNSLTTLSTIQQSTGFLEDNRICKLFKK